ncbi:KamA family radical SAM protein, partial [Candidatus Bipolaricaulota bacterium]|nr:KamA family radical SAM protein [Candidatus Bipolaricaulota bacterium]
VRSQVVPSIHMVRMMVEHRRDRRRAFDFMREADTSPADRVTRRYPAVAIFRVCDTCPQICTYCQRNWLITDPMDAAGIPPASTLEEDVEWFADHPHVTDVLLTGGDPLVLANGVLERLLDRLSELDHVLSIRIGTRTPVTMPMRIDEATARLLGSYVAPGRRSIEVMTHVQSAYEVTPELATAIGRLRARRIPVYNQQVFSLEVSRRFQAAATRVALRRAGIDPYYTFYAKGKDEHRDALVPIARLLQERKEEARLLPGVFRTDEPVFNVPGLGKNHLRASQDRELIGVRADGRRVYLFHPWEKGIAPVAPWPYTDVSIGEYLRRLERLGENPADYESIWYYY